LDLERQKGRRDEANLVDGARLELATSALRTLISGDHGGAEWIPLKRKNADFIEQKRYF